MLQRMRDGAQSLGARIMVGIIVVVLTVFGFGAFNLFAVGEPVAAVVDGEEITEAALEAETERRRRNLLAQLGEDADPSLIDAQALRTATLDGLVQRTLLTQFAGDLGIAVSDASLSREITANPEFQVDGAFDEDRFRATLASAGFSPLSYQERVAADERLTQVTGAIADTALVADREVRDAARVLLQRRDIAYLPVLSEPFIAAVELADEEIEARYESELDRYHTPETVDVEYVRLSFAAVMAEQDVTEAELRTAFDEAERDRLAAGDTARRRGAHILLEVGDERSEEEAVALLNATRAEVEAGADFADKARALSEDAGSAAAGGDLGLAERDAFVEPFADALWELEPGTMSVPVVTEFGVHLITLLEIEAVPAPTFEASRDALAETVKRQRAAEGFDERLRLMDEIAFEESDTLAGISETMGLAIAATAGITRDAGEGPFTDAALRQALFQPDVLVEGYNSPAIRVGEDAVVARVAARHPPAERPLDEVREEIRATMAAERGGEQAAVATLAALAQLREGTEVSEIAAAVGSEWVVREDVSGSADGAPQAILNAAFKLDPPPPGGRSAIDVETPPDGYALVAVTRVALGDYAAMTEADRATLRDQLGTLAEDRDLTALIESLRATADIE